jgi:hypothetical protein
MTDFPDDLRVWRTEGILCSKCHTAIQAKVEITIEQRRIKELEDCLRQYADLFPKPNIASELLASKSYADPR